MGNTIEISTEFIRLDAFLKYSGVASTGGEAKMMILDGLVFVDGEVCRSRGKKLYGGSQVRCGDRIFEVVHR